MNPRTTHPDMSRRQFIANLPVVRFFSLLFELLSMLWQGTGWLCRTLRIKLLVGVMALIVGWLLIVNAVTETAFLLAWLVAGDANIGALGLRSPFLIVDDVRIDATTWWGTALILGVALFTLSLGRGLLRLSRACRRQQPQEP